MADIILKDPEHLLGGAGFEDAEFTITFSQSSTFNYGHVAHMVSESFNIVTPIHDSDSGESIIIDTIVNSVVGLEITYPEGVSFDVENLVGCEYVDGGFVITAPTASCTITYK